MKPSHDTLATRLSLILTKLNSGERFTAIELSEEFNVDVRTIQRDINERLSYLPIEKNGKYYSLADYALGKLTFDDIKNFATLSGIKSLYPTLSNEFITDILNAKLNKAYLIKNQSFEEIYEKKEYFETLSAAIIKTSPVSFSYSNKSRIVNPYKLINNNGIWYLLAEEDNKLKTFTFSKIDKFNWDDEAKKFFVKKSFLKEIEENNSNWFSDAIEVILQIDNEAKEYFLRKSFLANKKLIEENEKHFLISTKVSFDDEILKLVQYWIPYIKIVEPMYLQDALNQRLQEYVL